MSLIPTATFVPTGAHAVAPDAGRAGATGIASSARGPALDAARVGVRHAVAWVAAPEHSPEWAMRLEEIGFIAGEQVMVMARAPFGGDPLVVRVGQSTFALRRAEAACVMLHAGA